MRRIELAWFGFWIFLSVYTICDTILYLKGNNTFFWQYKTPEEKILQMKIINGEVK